VRGRDQHQGNVHSDSGQQVGCEALAEMTNDQVPMTNQTANSKRQTAMTNQTANGND
jgi:hypothetical protein